MPLTCTIHEFDVERGELVVTVVNDAGTTILDRKNIGLPLVNGKPDFAEIERRVAAFAMTSEPNVPAIVVQVRP